MNVNDAFPSKYLKADDLDGEDRVFTIKQIRMETIGKGEKEQKLVIFFEDEEKGLVCNKTNAKTIAKLYGGDTDEWPGKKIILFPTEVEFQGEPTMAIRIRQRTPGASKTKPQYKPVDEDRPPIDDTQADEYAAELEQKERERSRH